MAFFISYPLSALGHDISPRADLLCYDLFIIYFNRVFRKFTKVA